MQGIEGPDGPFGLQVEWLNHRYDPGYFLGGTLRPELRSTLGSHGKGFAAVWAFSSGAALLGVTLLVAAAMRTPFLGPLILASALLRLQVGRRMWRAANANAPGGALDKMACAARLCQVAWMALVGGAFFVLAALATLGSLVVATLAVRGRADIIALVAVVVVVVIQYRTRRTA